MDFFLLVSYYYISPLHLESTAQQTKEEAKQWYVAGTRVAQWQSSSGGS
jgi:hypothetical protein